MGTVRDDYLLRHFDCGNPNEKYGDKWFCCPPLFRRLMLVLASR